MANGEVAVSDPDAVAPGDIGGGRVHIRIGRADVGDGGEQHGVELESVHPVFQVQLAGLFKATQTVRHCGNLIPGFQAALGHIDVFVHAGRQIALAVRQGARIVGEDLGPIDIGEFIELGIAVGAQEVVERPAGELPQLVIEKLRAHDATVEHGRCAGSVPFAVGDQREVHLDDLGARGFQRLARLFPQGNHRLAGVDALTGRAADAGVLAGAGQFILVDKHARHAEALALEGLGLGGQIQIGRRAHLGRLGQLHPGLHAPQIATGVGIVGHHHVQHGQEIAHGAGVGHHHVHGRGQRPVAAHRDDATGRGVGAQAVVGGRAPAARPGLFSQPKGGETGCGSGAGPVGGAGGKGRCQVVGVVGALGAAIDAALHAAVGHGRHIGFAQANRTGGAQALYGEGVTLGHQILERRAAGGGGQPLDQVAVFGGVGDAVQRPQGLATGAAGIGRLRLFQGIGVTHHDCVEFGVGLGAVIGLDAGQVGLDQFDRCGAAGFERGTQLGNGNFSHFDHGDLL